MKRLVWHDKHHLSVGETNFLLEVDWETCDTTESTSEEFLLVKTKRLTEDTLEHLPTRIDNMIEFGIFKGGSIALYEALFSPKRLVGVDIKPDRVEALDKFLAQRSATDRVELYYGVDQGDRQALDTIVRDNFAGELLDLVVDDGSHRYGPTKASLNRFLPLVREGGTYLIEDWGWAHRPRERPDADQYDDQQYPLSKLIYEVVMFAASYPRVIRDVLIDPYRAFVVRGSDPIDYDREFDISEAYRTSIWSFDFVKTDKSIDLVFPSGNGGEPRMHRSRYGGLWIDRRDAHGILKGRLARGEVSDADAEVLGFYIDNGYVVFENAVDETVIDDYLDLNEAAWNTPPDGVYIHWNRQVIPVDRRYYDEVTKMSDLHSYFVCGGDLIFPAPVLRFLTQIFDRDPVVFQSMTMRKGSQENLHIDTGPLTLTEPLAMAASWIALEDVQPHSGEFQFIPGSHRLPELLHYGTDKGHHGDYAEYGQILKTTLQMCEERGLKTESFKAKKGDVLIWHADLMHGGAPIEDLTTTRKSLVAHYMPLGVMPTFFDFSEVHEIRYPGGGYCLDRLRYDTTPRHLKEQNEQAAPSDGGHTISPIDVWRSWVPLSVRKMVPSKLGAWAKVHLHR